MSWGCNVPENVTVCRFQCAACRIPHPAWRLDFYMHKLSPLLMFSTLWLYATHISHIAFQVSFVAVHQQTRFSRSSLSLKNYGAKDIHSSNRKQNDHQTTPRNNRQILVKSIGSLQLGTDPANMLVFDQYKMTWRITISHVICNFDKHSLFEILVLSKGTKWVCKSAVENWRTTEFAIKSSHF